MKNNISEALERFYICTNLPVIAFDCDGIIIDLSGYDDKFDALLRNNNVYNKVINKLTQTNRRNSIIIQCTNGINYTSCMIDPDDPHKGIYILGPHSCIKNNPLELPYKPKCLMNNLVSFLRMIAKETSCGRHFKCNYSFHVKKALDYINKQYENATTLLDAANYLGINKSYLCTLLKNETGKTFTQILNEVRIEKSKSLLLESNLSMLETALAVGFNNQNYYNIIFKKITGMTPLEYRKIE